MIIREVTNIAVVGMFSVDLCITFTDSIGRSMFSMQRPVSFYKERPGIFLFFLIINALVFGSFQDFAVVGFACLCVRCLEHEIEESMCINQF